MKRRTAHKHAKIGLFVLLLLALLVWGVLTALAGMDIFAGQVVS